jgi:hypothetical protein
MYEALVQEHQTRIAREREKANYSFAARRKTIERIGLAEVRNYRLTLLDQEIVRFQKELEQKTHAFPEMVPLVMIRVEGGGMSSWRDQILQEFTPNVARLTLVADPDGLLLEEGSGRYSRSRVRTDSFEDPIAFRYVYEQIPVRWDRGEQTDLVVVLRTQANELGSLPYDLLQLGRKLSFNLGDIFPNLSYPVLTASTEGIWMLV